MVSKRNSGTMKNILLILLAIILYSCNKNKVFEKNQKFDNYDWNMDQVVKFDVPIEDTASAYNISILVRHTDNYPFDGLLINLSYSTPNGEEHTKNYKLNFRDEEGKFKGDGSGDIWDESEIIMKSTKFNTKGTYKFEITSNMPKTPVQGIMELGLLVEKN